jgi:hypothetical protein
MGAENWATIIVALIGLAGTIVTVIVGNKKNDERSEKRQKEADERSHEQTELILYRIGVLEKKQDKYNHLQERTYRDEQDIAVIKTDIQSIKEKMDYLHGE